MFMKGNDFEDVSEGKSSAPSGAGGTAGASTPNMRPQSAATPTGAVGRHGYGMGSPAGFSSPTYGGGGGGGGGATGGAYGNSYGSSYGASTGPSYGNSYGSRPTTGFGFGSGPGAAAGSGGDAARPATTGALGTAGALSTTDSRKTMLERQRELARQRRQNAFGGGVVATRVLDGPQGPRSPGSNPQRVKSIRQFSAPRAFSSSSTEYKDMPSSRPTVTSSPARGGAAGSAATSQSQSLAEVIRERERNKTVDTRNSPMTPVERNMARHGLQKTFDPKGVSAGGGGAPDAPELVPLDMSDMKTFLTSPLPKGSGIIQCYIQRNKSGLNRLHPVYHLFMKEGDKFLLAGKKRAKQKTSNYLISKSKDDLSREGPNFLGKLRSNFVGTEFYIYDKGMNPKDVDKSAIESGTVPVREELGLITYASNVLGSKGPRKMKVCLPRVHGTERSMFKPTGKDSALMAQFKSNNLSNIQLMINKPPRWNEQVGAYVLNFNGRVTMASVKNFQLVDPDDEEPVLLQFGRVGKDVFTMDVQHPLSPMQAFAICLSSFDYKIACE